MTLCSWTAKRVLHISILSTLKVAVGPPLRPSLRFYRHNQDFPCTPLTHIWAPPTDISSFPRGLSSAGLSPIPSWCPHQGTRTTDAQSPQPESHPARCLWCLSPAFPQASPHVPVHTTSDQPALVLLPSRQLSQLLSPHRWSLAILSILSSASRTPGQRGPCCPIRHPLEVPSLASVCLVVFPNQLSPRLSPAASATPTPS